VLNTHDKAVHNPLHDRRQMDADTFATADCAGF
jgi:hypothetical protein